MFGELALELGERPGLVAVKQAPVLPGQQLAEILAPVLAGDARGLVGERRVADQRVARELADHAVGVIAALHRPVAPRHQRTAGSESLCGAVGRGALDALDRGLQPARELERLALRAEPLAEPVAQALVERLRRDREQRPAAMERPLVQALSWGVPHRLGHVARVEPLLQHLRSRLGSDLRIGVLGCDKRLCVDDGLRHPSPEIVQLRELGLGRAAPGQAAALLDRHGELVQVAVVVGERNHAEPQIPVAPLRLIRGRPRLGAVDRRLARTAHCRQPSNTRATSSRT